MGIPDFVATLGRSASEPGTDFEGKTAEWDGARPPVGPGLARAPHLCTQCWNPSEGRTPHWCQTSREQDKTLMLGNDGIYL